jgi:hypothetical protein
MLGQTRHAVRVGQMRRLRIDFCARLSFNPLAGIRPADYLPFPFVDAGEGISMCVSRV